MIREAKANIAIVIPSYNEKINIKVLIEKIIENAPSSGIYIVDDNSPDGTQEVVKKLTKKYPRLSLITRNSKSGRGGAVIEGFRRAFENKKLTMFIEMDADLSHAPEEIKSLIDKTKKNTVVVGSRYLKNSKIIDWPLYRRILSRLANAYIKFILGVPINDFTNGFRYYPRKAVDYLLKSNINHKGFIMLSETAYILHKKGFMFLEVPITFKDREKGKSNATIPEILSSLLAVLQIRFGK